MSHSTTAAVRSTLLAAAVWALPLTQYTPLSKWMAFSLLTLQRIDPGDL